MSDTRPKVAVWTHGCRLNKFESDGIIGKFISSGRYRAAGIDEGPDIAIINTCTVTGDADSGNRNTIRKIIRKNPHAKVIVTGCHAHTDPDEIHKLEGVDFVIGNNQKSSIFEIYEKSISAKSNDGNSEIEKDAISENRFDYGTVVPHGHVRSYLKIQDGCNRKCTYCKIPLARGEGVSMASSQILEQFTELRDRGILEVVLTGVNLGWYRDIDKKIRFNDLLLKLLDISGNTRIRLSSIEPCDVDAALSELTLHPNFCNYLHVPLQSGSGRILRKMRRTYTPETFIKRIENVKKINPEIFLGTDIMVGFPSESDEDFQSTVKLSEKIQFAKIHIFPFSSREHTEAYSYSDKIPSAVIRSRINILRKSSETMWMNYALKFRKKKLKAIVENSGQFGNALTDNYLPLIYDLNKFSYLKQGDIKEFELITPVAGQKIAAKPVV